MSRLLKGYGRNGKKERKTPRSEQKPEYMAKYNRWLAEQAALRLSRNGMGERRMDGEHGLTGVAVPAYDQRSVCSRAGSGRTGQSRAICFDGREILG